MSTKKIIKIVEIVTGYTSTALSEIHTVLQDKPKPKPKPKKVKTK